MSVNVRENNQEKELIPAGVHQAVCCIVVDIGSVVNRTYGTAQRKVMIGWEIPSIRIKFEKDGIQHDLPKMAYKKYTASLSDKAYLKKDLEGWRGKAFTAEEKQGFDLSVLVGVTCQLNIIHEVYNNQTYANINGIFPNTQGKLTPESQTVSYGIDDDGENIPANMPEWLAKAIKDSPEYQALGEAPQASYDDEPPVGDDDVPF